MIVLIPLGGLGQRFSNANYKKPKPLINVMGKPIIFWLLDHIDLSNVKLVVIPYNNILEKYNFESMLRKFYPKINFKFLSLTQQTQGAAETILIGLDLLDEQLVNSIDVPVLCIDGDSFYTTNIIKQWQGQNSVFYFDDDTDSNSYSFLEIGDPNNQNSSNNIINIVEKTRISNYASTGCYGFKSHRQLKIYCQQLIDDNIRQKNEFYVSGVINLMLREKHVFTAKRVEKKNYHCLGTPLDVRMFCNNYGSSDNRIEKQRYCFDLDNTLVTYPEVPGDYSTVKPIAHTIDLVKRLKQFGHTIIIYTARRMNTHNGNTGKIMADIGKLTLDTIDKFGIPYDEIYFGKPYADFYIDDCAVSPFDNLEKELGFYKSTIETRSFNNIVSDCLPTYKKCGKDLSGEIYWYNNIPPLIKDMFPIFLFAEENCYLMEKINGIPFSRLYLSEEMTVEHLDYIMNSIEQIHTACTLSNDDRINIYDNYATKLQQRYDSYNYSPYKKSAHIYSILCAKLKEYENLNLGEKTIIHGDTVLTNILINQSNKIKFIDMRGKLGNLLTICGDKFYDWAKLYQSLIGYDEILENKFVSSAYRNSMIKHFTEKFIEEFGAKQFEYLNYLTASLLFSLIPIHDNLKCADYYNLIFNLVPI